MTDFLDKLKKGMDTEEPIEDPVEAISIELTSVQSVDDPEIEEPKPKEPKKTSKKKAKKKKIEVEEKEPEEKEEKHTDLFEGPEGELTVDVFQKDKELIIRSAIAGIDPEDLDIMIEDDLLIIKGERESKFAQEKENYFFQECHWGRFKREILLPVEVDSSRINAKLEKGILTIKIPIIERKSKTKVSVK